MQNNTLRWTGACATWWTGVLSRLFPYAFDIPEKWLWEMQAKCINQVVYSSLHTIINITQARSDMCIIQKASLHFLSHLTLSEQHPQYFPEAPTYKTETTPQFSLCLLAKMIHPTNRTGPVLQLTLLLSAKDDSDDWNRRITSAIRRYTLHGRQQWSTAKLIKLTTSAWATGATSVWTQVTLTARAAGWCPICLCLW